MGGHFINQWPDIFIQRDRREVDLVVAKKLTRGVQVPLLVVELSATIWGLRLQWNKSRAT